MGKSKNFRVKIRTRFSERFNKKIEYNNMKAEAIKHIDITMNNTRINEDTINSLDSLNLNIQKNEESEKKK